jgi:hypothetical protein
MSCNLPMSSVLLCSIRKGDFLFSTPFRPAHDHTQTSFSLVHSASRPHTCRGIAAGSDKLQLSDRIRILYIHVYCNACLLSYINPLNVELNPICHLLVFLGDLTFMGPCIVSIFQYTCILNKTQRYTVYSYLETALHVSGGTSTHHQERIQLYLQHLVFVTSLLLSSTIAADSSNGVTNTRFCRYSCMHS